MPQLELIAAAMLSAMRLLSTDIVNMGLFVKRADLLSLGHSDYDLRCKVASGEIIRVRKGWYSVPSAPKIAVEAFRIGGRLTGLSSLRTFGIWTPETRNLHVTVPADARGLRRPTDMRSRFDTFDGHNYRVSWTDEAAERCRPYVWRTSVIDALVHVLNSHDRVTSIVCLDAALHNRREKNGAGIVEADLDEIFARAPLRSQSWRSEIDGRAGSGGETEFRLKTLGAGIPFNPQPVVVGVGRLDGQIGPSTFVEIDGAEWHDNPEAFEVDTERDLLVAGKDGRVLRFTYALFRKKWEVCECAMRKALEADYGLAKSTDFPHFPWRMKPRKASMTKNLRRIENGVTRRADDVA